MMKQMRLDLPVESEAEDGSSDGNGGELHGDVGGDCVEI